MKGFAKLLIKLSVIISLIMLSACATNKMTTLDKAKQSYAQGNYPKAFKQLEKSARRGDPEAQYGLGYMFYYGMGTAKDPDVARSWIRKSAENGYRPAQEALMLLLRDMSYQYGMLDAQTKETLRKEKQYEKERQVSQPYYRAYQRPKTRHDQDLDWMRVQIPSHYTITFRPENNQAEIEKALKKVAHEARTAEYRLLVNGHIRYSGTFGTYPTQQAAQKGLHQIPASMQQYAQVEHWSDVQVKMLP